jgi:hypothetical protein
LKEKQVAFSFTSNLLANPDNADTFAALFKTLYMALDERQISYLQGRSSWSWTRRQRASSSRG